MSCPGPSLSTIYPQHPAPGMAFQGRSNWGEGVLVACLQQGSPLKQNAASAATTANNTSIFSICGSAVFKMKQPLCAWREGEARKNQAKWRCQISIVQNHRKACEPKV